MKAGATLVLIFFSTAAGAASLWDHNGSVVSLEANGPARKFYYSAPRPGLPVTSGVLLFDGKPRAAGACLDAADRKCALDSILQLAQSTADASARSGALRDIAATIADGSK